VREALRQKYPHHLRHGGRLPVGFVGGDGRLGIRQTVCQGPEDPPVTTRPGKETKRRVTYRVDDGRRQTISITPEAGRIGVAVVPADYMK
jgi:hypothetical protein